MDFTALTTAYTGLQFLRDSRSVALNAKIDEEARSKINGALDQISKLQDGLFQTQQNLLALQQENAELRASLQKHDAWAGKSSQYVLTATIGRAIVYKFSGEPSHYACPTCFESQKISPLQDDKLPAGTFTCNACKAQFKVDPLRGRGYKG